MLKKVIMTATLIFLILITGCSNDSEQAKHSNVSVVTDNNVILNLVASNMNSFKESKKGESIFSSIGAEIGDDSFDFSSLAYSDNTVCVGDVIYVEGTIPAADYSSDKVALWADPEDKVSFENAVLTNNGEDTVLTFEIVGEKVGTTEIAVMLEDSEYYHSFDIEVVDSTSRSMPISGGGTVYCTPTGGKYHSYGCGYLRGNGIAISLEEALAKGLGPCSRCRP